MINFDIEIIYEKFNNTRSQGERSADETNFKVQDSEFHEEDVSCLSSNKWRVFV